MQENHRDVDPQTIVSILRNSNHKEVPQDIEPTLILRADQAALDNARSINTLTWKDFPCLVLFPPFFLLLALTGAFCVIRKATKFNNSILEDADNDIYVISKQGFATINNNKVKSWTPAGAIIMPETSAFSKSQSSPCGSSRQSQTVLIVRKPHLHSTNYSRSCCDGILESNFKNGIYHQVWFVADDQIQNVMAQASLASASLMGMGMGIGMGSGANTTNVAAQLNQMMMMADRK